MENFDPKRIVKRQNDKARLERNRVIREATRKLRLQRHPARLKIKFDTIEKEDGRKANKGNSAALTAARRCTGFNSCGVPCASPAERGSRFCHYHNRPNAWAFQIGKRWAALQCDRERHRSAMPRRAGLRFAGSTAPRL